MATVAETTAEDLKSDCINGGHASYHFIFRRVLQAAQELPWSLARGDKKANLQGFRNGPMLDEPVSGQMWQLLHLGFNVEQLISTLELLSDVSRTTILAEQQHGSLAVLRR